MYQADRAEVFRSFINIGLRRMGGNELPEPLMVVATVSALLAAEADE
jgi:hypothetical protein